MNKKIASFLIFVFLSSLIAYFLVYKLRFVNQPIRSDAAGYYAYLPAFFIYQDFDFKEIDFYLPDARSLKYPALYYLESTRKNINKYPLGVSLLIFPLFFLGCLASRLFVLTITGYSLVHQHFVGLSGIFYLVLGLFFLSRVYKEYYSQKMVLLILTALVFATNLFHYATFDSLMSHIFSFALVSIFLYLISKRKKIFSSKRAVLIGIVLGLIFLVRNINLVFFFLLLPLVIKLLKKKKFKYLFLIFFSFLIVCLPQFLYWRYASGRFLFFSYQGEFFNFLKPQILKTLFSVRKGLFFWAPVFLLSFLGIKVLKKKAKVFFFSLIAVIFLFIYLTSSWYDWAYGASFGHRVFIDLYPVLALFLGAGLERLVKTVGLRRVWLIIICFIVLNLTNMFKYWQRILPYDQVSLEIYLEKLFIFIN